MKIKLDPVLLEKGQSTLNIPITIFTPDDYEKELAMTELTVQVWSKEKVLLGTFLTTPDGQPIEDQLPLAAKEANHVFLTIPDFPLEKVFAEEKPTLLLQFKFLRDRRDELDTIVKATMQQFVTHDQDIRIEFPKVRQTISARLLASLSLLALTFLLLIYWDSLHQNVLNQIPFFNNKLISGGIVAVFFYLIGFNQSALRTFFKSLANLLNFLQSVELYIDATLAKFYKHGRGVFFALLLFLGALLLVGFFLPVNLEIPKSNEIGAFMLEDDQLIRLQAEDKIYWKNWDDIRLGVGEEDTIAVENFCSIGGVSAFPYLDHIIYPTLPLFYRSFDIDPRVFDYRGCEAEKQLSSFEIITRKEQNTCLKAIYNCFQTGILNNEKEGVKIEGDRIDYIERPYLEITPRILNNAFKNIRRDFRGQDLPVPSEDFLHKYYHYLWNRAKDSTQFYQVAGLEKTTVNFLQKTFEEQLLKPETINKEQYSLYSNLYLSVFHFYLDLIQQEDDVDLKVEDIRGLCSQFEIFMEKASLRSIKQEHLMFLVKFYSELRSIKDQARPIEYPQILVEVQRCYNNCLDEFIDPNKTDQYNSERFVKSVVEPLIDRIQAENIKLHPTSSNIFSKSLMARFNMAIDKGDVCNSYLFDMAVSTFKLSEVLDSPQYDYQTSNAFMDQFNPLIVKFQTDADLRRARGSRCYEPTRFLLDRLSKNLKHATADQLAMIRQYELVKYDPVKRPKEKTILNGYKKRGNKHITELIEDFLIEELEAAANAPIGPEP
ncbi:MAG: hypothetical protein AAGH79_05315, partial [Bacteroidota bacterium]